LNSREPSDSQVNPAFSRECVLQSVRKKKQQSNHMVSSKAKKQPLTLPMAPRFVFALPAANNLFPRRFPVLDNVASFQKQWLLPISMM